MVRRDACGGTVLLAALIAGCGARSDLAPRVGPDAARTMDASVPEAGTDGGGSSCAPPLGRCSDELGCCEEGSSCVDPCGTGGLCTVPGRDGCGCGVVLDECDDPGTVCLFTFCDAPGVCVTPEEMREICGAGAPACFACPSCEEGLCAGPPAPVCDGPAAVRRFSEEWVGCDEEGRCLFAFERRDCPPGERCVDGSCAPDPCVACPPGSVCCDPGVCDPAAPPRCVPDPAPCVEPVAATGCDGRTYGTECDALRAGVCVNTCRETTVRSFGSVACARERSPGLFAVLRTRADFEAFFEPCALPYPRPGPEHHLVVVCERTCGGRVVLRRARFCDDGRTVVDYEMERLPAKSCASCEVTCDVAEVPPLTAVVEANNVGCVGPACC